MTKRCFISTVSLFVVLFGGFTLALPSSHAADNTIADPPTLAQELEQVTTSDGMVFLAVSPEEAFLPTASTFPAKNSSVTDIATAFGYTLLPFEQITAIAPATMVLLNNP